MSLRTAIFAIFTFSNLGLISIFAQDRNPTVDTKYGKIAGEALKSTSGREYFAFAGIPYGKPPIGNLRFKVNIYCVAQIFISDELLNILSNYIFKIQPVHQTPLISK